MATCAAACEADPLGCATDIQEYIKSALDDGSLNTLYPTTVEDDPNPTTPMHGLFNTMYVNTQAEDAIDAGIANPFDPIELPAWSIIAKVNQNPVDDAGTLETWYTPMYKIPGYCPEQAASGDDAVCVGGEWFWTTRRPCRLTWLSECSTATPGRPSSP
jgi:hypothetical protein